MRVFRSLYPDPGAIGRVAMSPVAIEGAQPDAQAGIRFLIASRQLGNSNDASGSFNSASNSVSCHRCPRPTYS
jgi:hypothetical protein